jgi:hypothetical protein
MHGQNFDQIFPWRNKPRRNQVPFKVPLLLYQLMATCKAYANLTKAYEAELLAVN